MDYGLWTAHGSLSTTVGASIAGVCCGAVIFAAGYSRWAERLERPAVLLCLILVIAVAVTALTVVPSVTPDDLAKALLIGSRRAGSWSPGSMRKSRTATLKPWKR